MNYFAIGLLIILAGFMIGAWIERICTCAENCAKYKYLGGHNGRE